MPLYSYVAIDGSGRRQKGTLEAPDEAALKEALRQRGLMPLGFEEAGAARGPSLWPRRVGARDLLAFTQELASLLQAGLPLDRALMSLHRHAQNPALRDVLREVLADIQRGRSLSQALDRHGRAFPQVYVNMVRAGEAGGILEAVLRRLAAFLQSNLSFREELVSALIYPSLLVVVAGLAVGVLVAFVLPRFEAIFEGMGQSLPLSTQLLLQGSEALRRWWWLLLGAVALVVLFLRAYGRTQEGRLFLDGLKLRLPLLRALHLRVAIARFARTFGTLLQSGVGVLEALRVSRQVLGNAVMAQRLQALEEGVRKGRGVAAPLREAGVFPPTVGEMLAVGEEAGRLEETLLAVAERYEEESRLMLKRLTALLEPALILLMGLVVGFIVLSILMAVFSVYEIPI